MNDKGLERIHQAKESIDDRFEAALKRWSDRNGSAGGGSTDDFADYIPNLLEELGGAICDSTTRWHDPRSNKKDLTVYFWPGYIRNKSTQRLASSRPNPFSGPAQVAVPDLSCGVGKKSGQSFFLCPSTYWYTVLERYKNPDCGDQFTPSGTHGWIVESHQRPGEKDRVARKGQHNISQLEVSALQQSKLPMVGGQTIKRDRVAVQLDLALSEPLAHQLRSRLEGNSPFTPWPWPEQGQPDLDDLCLRLYDIWLAATFTGNVKRGSTNDVEENVRRTISLLQTSKLQRFPRILGLDDKLQKLLSSWTAGDPLRASAVSAPNGNYLEAHFRFWNTLAITEPTVNSSQTGELGSAMLLSSYPLDPLYLMLLQNWIALYYSAIRSAEAAAEERKLGEGQVVSAFAHQIKHLTAIMAGNWHRSLSETFMINECDPEKLNSLGPTGELGTIFTTNKPILSQSSIFPHVPTLTSAGLLMKLWCMSDREDDIPFKIFDRPLDEIARDCWNVAVDEMAFFAIGRTLPGPRPGTFLKSASDFDRYYNLFKQIFSRIEITCWGVGATSPSGNCLEALPFRLRAPSQTSDDSSEYERVSKFVWFCRLLMSLLSDVIKHGDPNTPPHLQIHVGSQNIYGFVLSNNKLHESTRRDAFAEVLKKIDNVSSQDVSDLSKMLELMIIRNQESTKALDTVTGETVRALCSKELSIPWPRREETDSTFSLSFDVDFGGMR